MVVVPVSLSDLGHMYKGVPSLFNAGAAPSSGESPQGFPMMPWEEENWGWEGQIFLELIDWDKVAKVGLSW